MILDWNDFFEKAPTILMEKIPEVKAVTIATPIQRSPTKHTILVDVYYQGQVSKKAVNRFFSELAEKLSGSVYRGTVYRSDKEEEVAFEGRFEPRLSVMLVPFERMIEDEGESEAANEKDSKNLKIA